MEKFPIKNENLENEDLINEADFVINNMWEKVMDVNDLPLSVDSTYQEWEKDLMARKNEFARVLFNKARQSMDKEKEFFAKTLNRLIKLLNNEDKQEVLKSLMTTEEAIKELIKSAEKQVESKQTMPQKAKSKFKKKIDLLLFRDDDFDERLK